jgi:hypothetical protein
VLRKLQHERIRKPGGADHDLPRLPIGQLHQLALLLAAKIGGLRYAIQEQPSIGLKVISVFMSLST